MTGNPLMAAALAAAERGWHVFPLIPRGKRPAVKQWEERATTDPDRIRRCWTAGQYNIGIACGPSELVVVDLDVPKHPDDVPPPAWAEHGVRDGADVLRIVCERAGQPYVPTDTFTVRTRSGGTQLYYRAPADIELHNTQGESGNGLGWKVDTRGKGGLVVAAGSFVHPAAYTVAVDREPAPLPEWLGARLTPAPLPPQQPVRVLVRGQDRRSKFLTAAVGGEVQRVLTSGSDQHNTALYLAAVALGQLVAGGELTEAEATGPLAGAARQVGQKPGETARTIASGLKAGARRPRTVAA